MVKLFKPVGSVNHPRRILRRISRASLQVWPTPQSPTPAPGLDDKCLGGPPTSPPGLDDKWLHGELPEDPFSCEPLVTSQCPSPSTLDQQPSVQHITEPVDFQAETDDLDNDDAKTITLSLLYPQDQESLSDCSSDESFYPCLPTNSDLFHPQDDEFIALLEHLEATPYGEWSEIDASPAGHFMSSIYEGANDKEHQESSPSPKSTHSLAPSSLTFPTTQFPLTILEDLSPLSISAASVACNRRCMSILFSLNGFATHTVTS